MDRSTGTVDISVIARPCRVVFESRQAAAERLRAENAALSTRNRRLEELGPEATVQDLHAKVTSLTECNRQLEDRNRRFEHLLRELRRAMFEQKSEKLHQDRLQIAFEEHEGALAEADAPVSTTPEPRAKLAAGHPQSKLNELLPWNLDPVSS